MFVHTENAVLAAFPRCNRLYFQNPHKNASSSPGITATYCLLHYIQRHCTEYRLARIYNSATYTPTGTSSLRPPASSSLHLRNPTMISIDIMSEDFKKGDIKVSNTKSRCMKPWRCVHTIQNRRPSPLIVRQTSNHSFCFCPRCPLS